MNYAAKPTSQIEDAVRKVGMAVSQLRQNTPFNLAMIGLRNLAVEITVRSFAERLAGRLRHVGRAPRAESGHPGGEILLRAFH